MLLLNEIRESTFLWLANHLPRLMIIDKGRYLILRLAGMRFTRRATIYGPLTIRPIGAARRISIGNKAFLNTDIRFGVPESVSVTIGDNVAIGPRVQFECMHHNLRFSKEEHWGYNPKSIIVEDEVWIAAGAIVVGGVTIGKGAVIAAGCVVTENVEPYTLVGGVPGKVLRHL